MTGALRTCRSKRVVPINSSTTMPGYMYPKPTRGISSADAPTMINFSGVQQQRLLRVVQPASYSKALALCNLTTIRQQK